MSNLNATMATALSGLLADQGALETTTNNVANSSTPGYSRECPVLVPGDPVVEGPLTFGTGVVLQQVESVRDGILESRIQQETQQQGKQDALLAALQQTQVNFSSSSGDIGSAISSFFNSINQLSTNPSDLSLRQGVLTAAGNLATAFNQTAANLETQRTNLDLNVTQTVSQINQLTQQIAQLNGQISDLTNVGQNAGTFIDQRTQLIDQLSSLVDVSVIQSDKSITLTTSNGTALVAGEQAFQLAAQPTAASVSDVVANGQDITAQLTGGKLAGLIQARDQEIPGVLANLDSLASGLADAVNQVQTTGYDLNGNLATGVNLFAPPPAGGVGAAASMSVALTDPTKLAVSSDGSPGSNGNAEAMYAINNQAVAGNQTPTDYYSGIVFGIGNSVANATAEDNASTLVLQQLNDQRGSISGVSLNEEAANLVQYQEAYNAAAKVVTTISDMMQTVINMKTT